MKRLLALLAVLALVFSLSACDWFVKTPEGETTGGDTAETTAAEIPPDPGVPMDPVQGGPMLYTFYGRNAYETYVSEYDGEEYAVYPIGLIGQDGKLVSPPVYHDVQYTYDAAEQRVTGLVAVKDREITIYGLDGKSRVLPVGGYQIDVFPGGRYALIHAAQEGSLHGWDSEDPLNDGLYDLLNDRWAVEPKTGQMVSRHRTGGLAFIYQYDTPDATGEETAQWAYICADGSRMELPLTLGRVQEYYPETGWFGAIWTQGEWEHRYYDKDLKLIPALTGWSLDGSGFDGGQWCAAARVVGDEREETWVNRQGVFSDRRYGEIYNNGWHCYFSGDNFDWGKKTGVLFDLDLNEVCRTGPGERLAVLRTLNGSADEAFALLDADKNIQAVYDLYAKPMQAPAAFRCWLDSDVNMLYCTYQGGWRVLQMNQFFPKPKAGHADGEPYAWAIAACGDFIVVQTGVHWYEGEPAVYGAFAVGWDGKPYADCPLEPFYDLLGYQTAGEQGPYYYWIEQQDGRRGYINVKGEWLFVDEG